MSAALFFVSCKPAFLLALNYCDFEAFSLHHKYAWKYLNKISTRYTRIYVYHGPIENILNKNLKILTLPINFSGVWNVDCFRGIDRYFISIPFRLLSALVVVMFFRCLKNKWNLKNCTFFLVYLSKLAPSQSWTLFRYSAKSSWAQTQL